MGCDISDHGEEAYMNVGSASPASEPAEGTAAQPVLKPVRA